MTTPGPDSHTSSTSPSLSSDIDYSKWTHANPTDARSPCPMLNALANHSILPHSGRNISKSAVVTALHQAINLDPSIGNVFASVAVTTNPEHPGLGQLLHEKDDWTFDLDRVGVHGTIEHDCSLSRQDVKLGGDATSFDDAVWGPVIANYKGKDLTDFETASKARYERLQRAIKDHEAAGKPIEYGLKEAILSYGETALLMALLGDPQNGKIPVQYMKVLFEEERLPFNEGWRKNEKAVVQPDMNHLIFNLIKANQYKDEEAKQVGKDTWRALSEAVESALPDNCTIM